MYPKEICVSVDLRNSCIVEESTVITSQGNKWSARIPWEGMWTPRGMRALFYKQNLGKECRVTAEPWQTDNSSKDGRGENETLWRRPTKHTVSPPGSTLLSYNCDYRRHLQWHLGWPLLVGVPEPDSDTEKALTISGSQDFPWKTHWLYVRVTMKGSEEPEISQILFIQGLICPIRILVTHWHQQ